MSPEEDIAMDSEKDGQKFQKIYMLSVYWGAVIALFYGIFVSLLCEEFTSFIIVQLLFKDEL